jgi:flagellar protein FliO/FliZ
MTPTLFIVALFVVAIALIPYGIKWLKQKLASGGLGAIDASRIVSAVAVGANQRVVTLEVGPSHARVWLTLGITPTAINCLHKSPLLSESESRESGGFDKTGADKWNDRLV